mmetsp:Transcript_22935/g.42388  ORF Transcript_22935/g.42388 Transcript_22935/m.42388 type:complete len:233 (-) Transcript_22935:552-1250(-)
MSVSWLLQQKPQPPTTLKSLRCQSASQMGPSQGRTLAPVCTPQVLPPRLPRTHQLRCLPQRLLMLPPRLPQRHLPMLPPWLPQRHLPTPLLRQRQRWCQLRTLRWCLGLLPLRRPRRAPPRLQLLLPLMCPRGHPHRFQRMSQQWLQPRTQRGHPLWLLLMPPRGHQPRTLHVHQPRLQPSSLHQATQATVTTMMSLPPSPPLSRCRTARMKAQCLVPTMGRVFTTIPPAAG